ncbi:MAG: beta-ketoacyl synthase N-terminal-like domain-containing protein [Desulfobacterales bacterium]
MREVFVVRQAVATGLGPDIDTTWQGLLQGRSAVGVPERLPADRGGRAGVPRIPAAPAAARKNRVCALARRVLAAVAPIPPGAGIIWTGVKGNAEFIEAGQAAGMPYLAEHYLHWVAHTLGVPPLGFELNAACASSTAGIAIGALKIARGEYGAVLVCAADVATDFVRSGFSALKALSPTRCRPFDRARDGMCLGEGAVAILLADADTARACGLVPLARLSGWGLSNDATHITAPAADGTGLAAALEAALRTSGTAADEVGAFCAHGTGTVFNDAMELNAIERLFGDRRLPVFSIKGAVGHTLGAAGGIDAAVCIRALAERRVPPTAGLETPEPRASGRASGFPQGFDGRCILTSNSGFGGVNAALMLHSPEPIK